MEREPEEDSYSEHGEQGIHALFDLACHAGFFFGGVADALLLGFLSGRRKTVLGAYKDGQRDEHGRYGSEERVVDTGVEHVEVGGAELGDIACRVASHRGDEGVEVVEILGVHAVGDAQVLVAECRKGGVVHEAVLSQPPAAEHRGHKRGHYAADEHVEDLESGIALRRIAGIVVKLADNSLEVTLEQTVSECDEEERSARQRQQPRLVACSGEDRNGEDHISQCHHYQTPDDGRLVVLCLVGDDTAHKAQYVDSRVEEGINKGAGLFGESEFRTQEEHEHRVHDVVAEPFAHV